MFKAVIDTNRIVVTNPDKEIITSGSVNVNFIQFSFSEDWADLQKTVLFQTKKLSIPIILEGNSISYTMPIPWEVLLYPNESINVGAYGTRMDDSETFEDEEIVLPTVWGTIPEKIRQGVIVTDPTPSSPTYDAYQRLLKAISDILENGVGGDSTVSPVVTVEKTDYGHLLTIADVDGEKTIEIRDGEKGTNGTDGKAPLMFNKVPTTNNIEAEYFDVPFSFLTRKPDEDDNLLYGVLANTSGTDAYYVVFEFEKKDIDFTNERLRIYPASYAYLVGPRGATGAVYTPHITATGILTWTNNGGLSNPSGVNLKGPKGDKGASGDPGPVGLLIKTVIDVPNSTDPYNLFVYHGVVFSSFNRTPVYDEYGIGMFRTTSGDVYLCVFCVDDTDDKKAYIHSPYDASVKITNSENSAEIENGSSNGEVYSTKETRIGTWIDGKPLYRKVIESTTSSYEYGIDVADVTDLSIEVVTSISGWVVTVSNDQIFFNTTALNGTWIVRAYMSGNNTKVFVQASAAAQQNRPCTIILEYTKTTDQAATKTTAELDSEKTNVLLSIDKEEVVE